MTSVLDTTAFSAAVRQDESMVEFLRSGKPGDMATVPPVVAEIEYGIRRMESASPKRLLLEAARDRLLAVIGVLAWTPEASASFGSIKAALERIGEPIDDFDIATAAIAKAHGGEVITANLAHLRRIEGLRSRHWVDPSPGSGT